jgi:hypothetical protein
MIRKTLAKSRSLKKVCSVSRRKGAGEQEDRDRREIE